MSSEQFSATPPPLPPRRAKCPHCGAEIFSTSATECWLCHERITPPTSTAPDTADDRDLAALLRRPARKGDNPAWIVFGVLAILVCLGLATEGPGVLIVLLILATPALIRAALASWRQANLGAPLTGLDIAGTFLSSVGIVAVIGLASFAAFFVACFAVCLGQVAASSTGRGIGDSLLYVSVGAGILPGLLVAAVLFRFLWPRRG